MFNMFSNMKLDMILTKFKIYNHHNKNTIRNTSTHPLNDGSSGPGFDLHLKWSRGLALCKGNRVLGSTHGDGEHKVLSKLLQVEMIGNGSRLANNLLFTLGLEPLGNLRFIIVRWTDIGGIMHCVLHTDGWKCIQANTST